MNEALDANGDPTPQTLNHISFWQIYNINDVRELIQFIEKIWRGEVRREIIDDDEGIILYTGGWASNEVIISALEENIAFMDRCWYASFRGGKHVFVIQ